MSRGSNIPGYGLGAGRDEEGMVAGGRSSAAPSPLTLAGSGSPSQQQPQDAHEAQQSIRQHQTPLVMQGPYPSLYDERYDKYWRKPLDVVAAADGVSGKDGFLSIHVCDENRKMTRDFCCKRSVLMEYVKYFESFLKEAESGYDDIDISVHCDVDIFEWLMTFINYPFDPPHMDKTMVVSILISSEFLQIEPLIDMCIKFMSRNLSDIIKLPIDLSCISDKLLLRLAQATPSSILAQTKDRRDKILNKLYKRRVELDFSRKAPKGGGKALASTLTCCRKCNKIYLDSFVNELLCSEANPAIDFRGRLTRRHSPAADWSLTSYLKLLHSGGMTWEAIYWHVWSACAVISKDGVFFNAQDTQRYVIDGGGINVNPGRAKTESSSATSASPRSPNGSAQADPASLFSLTTEDDAYYRTWPVRIEMSMSDHVGGNQESPSLHSGETGASSSSPSSHSNAVGYGSNSLFPTLPITKLTPELLHLLTAQQKHFETGSNSTLIENSIKATLSAVASNVENGNDGALWDWSDQIYAKDETDGRARGRARRGASVGPGYSRKGHSLDVGSKPRTGIDSESPEPSKITTLRSRSSGAAIVRSNSRSGVGENALNAQTEDTENGEASPSAADEAESSLLDSFPVYKMLPAHVHAAALRQRGPLHGVWLQQHPLQLSPDSFKPTIEKVFAADSLSKIRKDEWFLDVIREYDEKRMECLEDFLIGYRTNVEMQMQSSSKILDTNSLKSKKRDEGSRDYNRDKGRQPRSVKAYSFNL